MNNRYIEKMGVFVYLPGETQAVPAGIFRYDSYNQFGCFSYDRQFIDRYHYPISPDLPITRNEASTARFNGLFAAFRDNLPDAFGRYAYWFLCGTSWKTVGDFGLLATGGSGRVGNLDFRPFFDSVEPDCIPEFSDLEKLVHEINRMLDHEALNPDHKQLVGNAISSIGGMRAKCTIRMGDSLWIAKLPGKSDKYDVVKVEAAMMHMASQTGITVPRVEVKQIGDKSVYLIERFDRQFDPSLNAFTRIGYVSALSLFGEHEDDRFYFGYPDFADVLRKHSDIAGCRELYKRMLFNVAIKNIDDHARNHGFLVSGHDLKLSPVFDLTPTDTHPKCIANNFYLAVSLGKQGWLATIENALSDCERFGITRSQALIYADEVAEAVSGWSDVFKFYEVPVNDVRRFQVTMETAVDRLRMK